MVKKQAFERAIAVDVPDKTLAEIHTEFESIGKCSREHGSVVMFSREFILKPK